MRKRNRAMYVAFVITGLLLYSCTLKKPASVETRPNIILIYADDLGWADVGFNGNTFYETPNIDGLAQEGLICTRFYPSAANCAPSRACMLTGTYAPRHKVYLPQGLSRGGDLADMRYKTPAWGADSSFFNTFDVSINHVDSSFTSLADLLNQAGYVTARFGKWHIGGNNQGFDVNSAAGEVGKITNRTVTYPLTENRVQRGGKEERFYSDTAVAERLTDAAITFIRNHKDQPFFLYLSHWEVHTPLAARNNRISYYENKMNQSGKNNIVPAYAAEVEQLDISTGRILQVLDDLELKENTIVIFTSDNGGVSEITSNAPLRAGKGTYYEGGIRTPFCIRWPGNIKSGTVTDMAVSGVDLLPTFAEIANVPLPENQPVDGLSLLPLFEGRQPESTRSIFFHFPLYLGGGGPDKVLPTFKGQTNYWRAVPLSVIMKGDWKLIHYYEYDSVELYNVKEDIAETTNLSHQYPEKVREMLVELDEWISETQAPVPSKWID